MLFNLALIAIVLVHLAFVSASPVPRDVTYQPSNSLESGGNAPFPIESSPLPPQFQPTGVPGGFGPFPIESSPLPPQFQPTGIPGGFGPFPIESSPLPPQFQPTGIPYGNAPSDYAASAKLIISIPTGTHSPTFPFQEVPNADPTNPVIPFR